MIDSIDELKCSYWMRSGPWVLPQRYVGIGPLDENHTLAHSPASFCNGSTLNNYLPAQAHTDKSYLYDCSISIIPAHYFFCFPYLLRLETIKPDPS